MAKSPIVIAPGLALDGEALTFAGHGTDLETIIARATSRATLDRQDEVVAEVNAACKMHASAWGAVLALDPEVAAITPDADPLTVGPILVAAVQRAAHDCADPCALVLAVAEAARLHTLAALPKPRKVEPPERARQRVLLAVPCTVEAVGWHPAPLAGCIGSPATAAEQEGALRAAAAFNVSVPRILPAVRLRGGLLGRSGVTLRPAGESSLAWAAAAWRVSCAALGGPRKAAEPRASAAKIAELPIVVSVDGVPVMWGNLAPTDVAATLAPDFVPVVGGDPAAFVAEATRRRDEAFKIEGEASDLAMVADPSWTLHDVPETQQAAVRGLAVALIAGDARAPDFERVRDDVRPSLKEKRRRKHWGSNHDRVQMWAGCLLIEVQRVQRIAEDLKREEEARRRAEKQERSQARKRAA